MKVAQYRFTSVKVEKILVLEEFVLHECNLCSVLPVPSTVDDCATLFQCQSTSIHTVLE